MMRLFLDIQFGGSLAELADMVEKIKEDHERRQMELQAALDEVETEAQR